MSRSILDARIDALYQGPLDEFIPARQALAKTLTAEERKRVAGLQKPLTLPWIVNQTYWRARRTYDDLLDAGGKLRAAQVGALKGRATDIRSAADQHAQALTRAVGEATRIAESAGVAAPPDALRRMFEAVSTRESLPAPHGRFVKPLEPAGFEALAGLAIAPPSREPRTEPEPGRAHHTTGARPEPGTARGDRQREQEERRYAEEQRRRERERAEAARRRNAAIKAAENRAAQAVEAERRARVQWEQARRDLEAADRALAELLQEGGSG